MVAAPPPRRRVVVTGMGCVTPLGPDLETTFRALLDGHSGIRPISRFDPSALPVRIAGEVREEPPVEGVPEKERRRIDRFAWLALGAAVEAMGDAGLSGPGSADPERAGVAMASAIGGIETIITNHRAMLEGGVRRISPFAIPMCIPNMASGLIAIRFGLRGPNLCHATACASGAHAIGESLRLLRSGAADVMIAGGAEAPIIDFVVGGFARMRALSTRNDAPEAASRPFDADRDGFVMAEGAGALVLETLEHALARGARIRGEVLGYGLSADAHHIANPREDGAGALACMRLALADAGLGPGDVDHVNPHATSTPAGDLAEARALAELLGPRRKEVPVSATKGATGHLLGAAGAVEAILALRSLEAGWLPPTLNLLSPDPECDLDLVTPKARETRARVALSNSFGFGGTNATLVLGRFDDTAAPGPAVRGRDSGG